MIRKAFYRAAAKPEGSTSIDFLKAILRERPDLCMEAVYFPSPGSQSYIVIIGDEVFKGPTCNSDYTLKNFEHEQHVLQAMEGKGLPVPKVTCIGKETVFYGMTRMPGVMPDDDFFNKMTRVEMKALARDIAGFIVGMAQTFPLGDKVFLAHNDLHAANILVDPATKRLSGVVDFGITTYVNDDGCWQPNFLRVRPEFKQILRREYRALKRAAPAVQPLCRLTKN